MTTEVTETSEVSNAGSQSEGAVVSKMRDSDIRWREKYKLTKSELEGFKAKVEQETQTLRSSIDSVHKEMAGMEQKLIDAKLEAAAVAAGITDSDLVKLIDKSTLKVENGELTGLAEAVQSFKTSKPHFFGAEKKTSSSTNAPLPENASPIVKRAADMTDAEYKMAASKLRAGRF